MLVRNNSLEALQKPRTSIHDAGTPKRQAGGNVIAGGEPCFYLNSGNGHFSDHRKIMLPPSAIASYSTDVICGYRRALFGEGTTIIGSPSPAKEGKLSVTVCPAIVSAAEL